MTGASDYIQITDMDGFLKAKDNYLRGFEEEVDDLYSEMTEAIIPYLSTKTNYDNQSVIVQSLIDKLVGGMDLSGVETGDQLRTAIQNQIIIPFGALLNDTEFGEELQSDYQDYLDKKIDADEFKSILQDKLGTFYNSLSEEDKHTFDKIIGENGIKGFVDNWVTETETAVAAVNNALENAKINSKTKEEFIEQFDILSKASEEYNENGFLSTELLTELEAKLPGIVSALYDQTGALTAAGKAALTSAKGLIRFAASVTFGDKLRESKKALLEYIAVLRELGVVDYMTDPHYRELANENRSLLNEYRKFMRELDEYYDRQAEEDESHSNDAS